MFGMFWIELSNGKMGLITRLSDWIKSKQSLKITESRNLATLQATVELGPLQPWLSALERDV